MEPIVQFIVENSRFAPWMTFGLVLLAGCNLPISIDVVICISAFLAATTIPEHTFTLYISLLVGCYFSAWIAYWIGWKVGRRLLKVRYLGKMLPEKRLKKIEAFYEKHGLLTLLVGRFIPLGMRNCIFMSTGISQSNFRKFIRRDALACSVWITVCFFGYYSIGHNYELLLQKIKTLNLFIFLTFGVAVIGLFCYKKYRKKSVNALDKKSHLDS